MCSRQCNTRSGLHDGVGVQRGVRTGNSALRSKLQQRTEPKPGVPAAPRWGRVDRGTPFGKNQSYGGWLRKGLFSGYAAVEGFRHRRM